jgi:hypothetical protein
VVPVEVAPPATVVVAVIVKVVTLIATVGVPDMTPVAVSKVSPAGSGPDMEYRVFVGDVAVIEVEIGAMAVPTVPVALDVEVVTASGVVKLVVVEDVPAPLLFVAVVVTE